MHKSMKGCEFEEWDNLLNRKAKEESERIEHRYRDFMRRMIEEERSYGRRMDMIFRIGMLVCLTSMALLLIGALMGVS